MHSINRNKEKSLRLTAEVFGCLHKELLRDFSVHYSITIDFLSHFQLYGFDHYDDSKPNLRGYVYLRTNTWVNGKYLYNKVRDFQNGKKEIKLTRQYVYLYFQVLRCKGVFEFITSPLVREDARARQLQLCGVGARHAMDSQYYVGYYFGEDAEIIKTCLTLYDDYTRVVWELIYWESQQPSTYIYKGLVKETKTTVSFYFKAEHSSTERYAFIAVFFGNRNVVNKPFLFGTYSGFDRNDCPVAGEIIFQRVLSKEEQEELAYSKEVDFVIQDLITNRRIVASTVLPQQKVELSQDSFYAGRLSAYSGLYAGYMLNTHTGKAEQLCLIVKPGSNQAYLTFGDGREYAGYFKIIHQGTVLQGWFGLSLPFQTFSLVLNSAFLKEKYLFGVYLGVGTKGDPLAGKVCFIKDFHAEDMAWEEGNGSPGVLAHGWWDRLADGMCKEYLFSGYGSVDFLSQAVFKNKTYSFVADSESSHVIHGTYNVYYWDEGGRCLVKDLLQISKNREVLLSMHLCVAQGTATPCEDGILSICFDWCDKDKVYLRFLLFVGRYRSDEIRMMSGVGSTISKNMTPMARKVIFVRTDEPFKSQASEMCDPKSEFIRSLCVSFPGFDDLVHDPSFRPVETVRSVN